MDKLKKKQIKNFLTKNVELFPEAVLAKPEDPVHRGRSGFGRGNLARVCMLIPTDSTNSDCFAIYNLNSMLVFFLLAPSEFFYEGQG